jgi:hypothetical protein
MIGKTRSGAGGSPTRSRPRARAGRRWMPSRRAPAYGAERAVREHLGATIGWGVAIAIGVPLLAILALVTLVGIPFGVALLLAAIPVLLVAFATTAWIVGHQVLRNTGRSRHGRRCWPARGFCACSPSSPSRAPSSGSQRRSWDSEHWPSRCGRRAGRARPRRGPKRRLRAVPPRQPDRCATPVSGVASGPARPTRRARPRHRRRGCVARSFRVVLEAGQPARRRPRCCVARRRSGMFGVT